MAESSDQIDFPFIPHPDEREATAQMDPLQQQLVELFERFQTFNRGFQEKVSTPHAQGKAKDWRAQKEIEALFLKSGEVMGNRAIRNRLTGFIQIMEAKLSQMEGNDRFTTRRYPTQKEWQKPENRHFMKTIQEILCDPTDFILFSKKEVSENQGIAAIIINPQKITNTLLENLGLDEFCCYPTEEKPRFTATERLERFTAAIPEIRRMISSLEPIRRPDQKRTPLGELKYFRMMRIGEKSPQAGTILGTQINNGKRILFHTDLHGADRRLIHIDQGYQEEQEKLATILSTLDSIDRNKATWSGQENNTKREELYLALQAIIDSMKEVKNHHKKRLRENLKTYLDIIGGNPGAAGWALERARINLGERMEEMEGISGNLKKDAQKLNGLILAQERPYAEFLRDVESIQDEFADTSQFDPAHMRPRLNALRTHITETMQFEPYRSVGKQCLIAIEQALRDLGQNESIAAAESFLKVYSLTKLERAYYKICKANRDLVERGEDQVDPQKVLDRVTAIYNELRTHQLAPSQTDDSIRDSYIQFYKMLDEIRFTLGDLLKKDQPDIESYRTTPIESSQTATPPRKEWKQKLSAILENQTSRIKGFLKKALDRAKEIIRREKPTPQPDLPFQSTHTPEEAYDALVKVRRIMSDYPFTKTL